MVFHTLPGRSFVSPHRQLAALDLSGHDVLVDHSVVGIFQCSHLYLILIFYDDNAFLRLALELDVNSRVLCVSRAAVQIEFCGLEASLLSKEMSFDPRPMYIPSRALISYTCPSTVTTPSPPMLISPISLL